MKKRKKYPCFCVLEFGCITPIVDDLNYKRVLVLFLNAFFCIAEMNFFSSEKFQIYIVFLEYLICNQAN